MIFRNKAIIKDLYVTCERLSLNRKNWVAKRGKKGQKILDMIEEKGDGKLTRQQKIILSEFFEIKFYDGKILAYVYMLQELSGGQFMIKERLYPNFFEHMERLKKEGTIDCTHLKRTSWNK